MFRKLIVSGAALSLAAASTAALADDHRYDRDWGRGGEYDYARVLDVEPIVREVRVSVPHEECWDETVRERGAESPRAGGMILGGLIGGVLGHQVGRGRAQRNATIAGAVIGSAIGHDAAGRRDPRDGGYRTVERCETQYEDRVEERIDGYRVRYEYGGREYQTRLPYDPGNRMRVRVDVSPASR